jgi:peptide subunit release factor 1 (eRF1)
MSSGKIKLSELLEDAKNMKCFYCKSTNMDEPNWDGSNSVVAKCNDCGQATALVTTGQVIDDVSD